MGNDGGSIPKRDDLVRTKARQAQVDEQEKQSTRWSECSLSKQSLENPIVCDRLGRLYNKSSVLEFLINRDHFGQDGKQIAGHLRNLKDLIHVRLTKNVQSSSWICPITLKEFGVGIGMSELRWLCLIKCGCVLTETGLKQVQGNDCPVCGTVVSEFITINPNLEQVEEIRMKILQDRHKEEELKAKRKLEKKDQKRKNLESDSFHLNSEQTTSTFKGSKKSKTCNTVVQHKSIQPSSNIHSTSIAKLTAEVQKETQQNLVNLSSATHQSIYGPRDADGKQLLGQQKESWMTRGTWTRYAA